MAKRLVVDTAMHNSCHAVLSCAHARDLLDPGREPLSRLATTGRERYGLRLRRTILPKGTGRVSMS